MLMYALPQAPDPSSSAVMGAVIPRQHCDTMPWDAQPGLHDVPPGVESHLGKRPRTPSNTHYDTERNKVPRTSSFGQPAFCSQTLDAITSPLAPSAPPTSTYAWSPTAYHQGWKTDDFGGFWSAARSEPIHSATGTSSILPNFPYTTGISHQCSHPPASYYRQIEYNPASLQADPCPVQDRAHRVRAAPPNTELQPIPSQERDEFPRFRGQAHQLRLSVAYAHDIQSVPQRALLPCLPVPMTRHIPIWSSRSPSETHGYTQPPVSTAAGARPERDRLSTAGSAPGVSGDSVSYSDPIREAIVQEETRLGWVGIVTEGDLQPLSRMNSASDVDSLMNIPMGREAENGRGRRIFGLSHMLGQPARQPARQSCDQSDVQQKKPKKKKGKQTEERRVQTGITRSWRACRRCRAQKIRCEPNKEIPDDPNAECQTCLDVRHNGKLIHAVPCDRARLNFIVARVGMLGYTERFDETRMENVPGTDTKVYVIHVKHLDLGTNREPLQLEVKSFQPIPGDTVERCWTVGGRKAEPSYRIEPYCLVDIEKTKARFVKYLTRYCFMGLRSVGDMSEEPIVRTTYGMICQHYEELGRRIQQAKKASKPEIKGLEIQRKILGEAVFAWYAGRYSSGSVIILPTGSTLGMKPSPDPTYPHKDENGNNALAVPRMISAQFDSIQHNLQYARVQDFIKDFQALIETSNHAAFLTCHLVVFLFLHWTAVASKQRASRAKRRAYETNGILETPYGKRTDAMTRFVEEMHRGAVNLLRYWQYYKSDVDFRQLDWDGRATHKRLSKLEHYEFQFIRESAEAMRKVGMTTDLVNQNLKRELPHELYFVEKMYMAKWYGFEIFSC